MFLLYPYLKKIAKVFFSWYYLFMSLSQIKVISFDVEGTLVTPDFSYAIWFEAIPKLYAQKYGVSYQKAREIVTTEYNKVGDQRLEWYDIYYWFNYFGLGTPLPVLKNCESKVCYYPEVFEVLSTLTQKFKLIVASSSSREFLRHLLKDIEAYFTNIFSSISDYKQLKTNDFYIKICQELEISPHQLVHVGDNRQADFDIPRQLGIWAFHLDRDKKVNCPESITNLKQLQTRLLD